MDMDTTQWAQVSSTSNNINNATLQPQLQSQQLVERPTKPPKEQALKCPRCNSTNTKFCYYNNYSLTQPRYICKACKRYWTQGGSLRSVPVGGGSRKNKKHSCSNNSSSTKINNFQPTNPMMLSSSFMPRPHYDQVQELNLGFSFGASFPNIENSASGELGVGSMELLRRNTSAMYGSGGASTIPDLSCRDDFKFPSNGISGDHGKQLFSFGGVGQVKSSNEINEMQNKGSQGGDDQSMLWNGGSW